MVASLRQNDNFSVNYPCFRITYMWPTTNGIELIFHIWIADAVLTNITSIMESLFNLKYRFHCIFRKFWTKCHIKSFYTWYPFWHCHVGEFCTQFVKFQWVIYCVCNSNFSLQKIMRHEFMSHKSVHVSNRLLEQWKTHGQEMMS